MDPGVSAVVDSASTSVQPRDVHGRRHLVQRRGVVEQLTATGASSRRPRRRHPVCQRWRRRTAVGDLTTATATLQYGPLTTGLVDGAASAGQLLTTAQFSGDGGPLERTAPKVVTPTCLTDSISSEQNVQTSGHELLTSDCNFKLTAKRAYSTTFSIKIRDTCISVNATTFTQKRHAGAINLARNVWIQVRWLSGPGAQRYRHTRAHAAIQAHTQIN